MRLNDILVPVLLIGMIVVATCPLLVAKGFEELMIQIDEEDEVTDDAMFGDNTIDEDEFDNEQTEGLPRFVRADDNRRLTIHGQYETMLEHLKKAHAAKASWLSSLFVIYRCPVSRIVFEVKGKFERLIEMYCCNERKFNDLILEQIKEGEFVLALDQDGQPAAIAVGTNSFESLKQFFLLD